MINKMLIILLLFFAVSARAEDTDRISIAIMEFRANNTKEAYGRACVDMLSQKLFATNLFTVMEKSQMDRIARLNGFNEFNIVDPDQVAKLGRVLNVEKIIVGSITYIDSYIIDVKILNTKSGEIEFNVKRKISSISKLDKSLEDISELIERHYRGYDRLSGIFDLTVEGRYIFPLTGFGDSVNSGPGGQLVLSFNNPAGLPFNLQATGGFYNFSPATGSMNYFYMIPFYLGVSYRFAASKNINIEPSVGSGYVFSKVSSSATAAMDDIYWNNDGFYYNPVLTVRAGIDILLHDRWYLVFAPQYTIFFEKEGTGQFVSMGMGIKVLF